MSYKKNGNEGLTQKEQKFINKFFDVSIDTKSLKKSFNPNSRRDIYAEYKPDEDRIIFYGKEFINEDFVSKSSMLQFAMFMHEVTHAWQYQNGKLNDDLDNSTYDYKLSDNSEFSDFGEEQQAAMVEDYAAFFLHPYEITDNHSKSNKNWNPELLKRVVEEHFPNAKDMRECIEDMDKTLQIRFKSSPSIS